MTNDGNHGGATDDEINASLFVFSPKNFLKKDENIENGKEDSIESFPQIDFVPTFSFLLNIPTPYANLGRIIPNFFLRSSLKNYQIQISDFLKKNNEKYDPKILLEDGINFLNVLHLNCWQIFNFISTYVESTNQFSSSDLFPLQNLFSKCNENFEKIKKFASENEKEKLKLISKTILQYISFHSEAHLMCNSLWTVFKTDLMTLSTVLMFLVSIFIFSLIFFDFSQFSNLFDNFFFFFSFFGSLFAVLYSLLYLKGESMIIYSIFGFSITSLSYIIYKNVVTSRISFSFKNLENLFSIFLFILYCISLFSNSFIESEQNVSYFFLISMLFIYYTKKIIFSTKKTRNFVYFLIVINSLYFSTKHFNLIGGKHDENLTIFQLLFFNLIPSSVLFYFQSFLLSQFFQNSTKNLTEKILSNFFFPSNFFLLIIYRLLHYTNTKTAILMIPRMIYLISFISISVLFKICEPKNRKIFFLIFFSQLISLLYGPKSPLLIFFYFSIFYFLFLTFKSSKQQEDNAIFFSTFFFFLCIQIFYSSGHFCSFSSIKVDTAFIGFDNADNMFISSFLIILETFSSHFFVIPCISFFFNKQNKFLSIFFIFFFFSFSSLCTTVFVFLERRHLMVWRVFAPKYIFQVSFLLISNLTLIFVSFIF